jgi:hypothetical protein
VAASGAGSSGTADEAFVPILSGFGVMAAVVMCAILSGFGVIVAVALYALLVLRSAT